MKKYLIILWLLLLINNPLNAKTIQDSLNLACKAYDDGFYDAAQRYFEDAFQTDRSNFHNHEIFVMYISSMFFQEKFQAVIKEIDRFLSIQTNSEFDDLVLFWKIKAYLNLSDLDKVNQIIKTIEDSFPESEYILQSQYELGLYYFNQHNYEKAFQIFDAIYDSQGGDISENAYFLTGKCLYFSGKYFAAEKRFVDFVTNNPNSIFHSQGKFWIGESLFKQTKYDHAIKYLLESISQSEDFEWYPDALFRISWCYINLKDYLNALKYLDQCIQTYDQNAEVLKKAVLEKIRILNLLEQYDQLEIFLKKSIDSPQLNHFKNNLQYLLSNNYLNQGKNDLALQELNLLLDSIDKSSIPHLIYFLRGKALFSANKFHEGIQSIEKAMSLNTEKQFQFQCATEIGNGYFLLKDYLKAEKIYKQIFDQYKDFKISDKIIFHLAQISLNLNHTKEGVDYLNQLISQYPKSIYRENSLFSLGWNYYNISKYEESIETLQRMINEFPDSEFKKDIYYKLANAYFNLKKYKDAEMFYKKIIQDYQADSVFVYALHELGWTYYHQNKIYQAVYTFEEFLKIEEKSTLTSETLFILGQIYFNQKKFHKSQSMFKKLWKNYPVDEFADDAMFWHAKSLQNLEKYNRAIKIHSSLINTFPKSELYVESLFSQGECLKALKKYKEASSKFKMILIEFKNSYLEEAALVHWGDCLYLSENYIQAIELYNKVIKNTSSKNYAKSLYKIGRCYRKLGDLGNAIDQYLRIIYEFDNEDLLFTKAIFGAAECYENKKDYKHAIDLYQKIIDFKKPERVEAQRRIELIKQKSKSKEIYS